MTDTTDLIQRLRRHRGDYIEEMDEAADALEQQAADLAYVKAASVFNLMEENKRQAAQIEALRADAERLRLLLSDARCALDYHQEQTRPIHSTRTALEAIDAELRKV